MAEVWLARNVHLGTPAAVKFLTKSYAGVPEIEQRFLNEGRRQGGLNHPNIIKVYGFEYVDDRSFLILQFIDGEALDRKLRRVTKLAPDEAARIAIPILSALHHAHEHNIVHRDIKPSNILLDGDGVPYLGDFGIVLATNEKRITRTGMTMGTSLYMSPEQIREPSLVDRRSDIYSFGCVLYEMLTGQPPFPPPAGAPGDTDFLIKMAHIQQPPPPLRQKNPALSSELEAVVMRCLAKTQPERYQTCMELRNALGTAMAARAAATAIWPQQSTMPMQSAAARPAPTPGTARPQPSGPPVYLPQSGPPPAVALPPRAAAPPPPPAPMPQAPAPPAYAPPAYVPPAAPPQQFQPAAYIPPASAQMNPQYQMAQYGPPGSKSSTGMILGIVAAVLIVGFIGMEVMRSRHPVDTTTTTPGPAPADPQNPAQPPPNQPNNPPDNPPNNPNPNQPDAQQEDREAQIAKAQSDTFMATEAKLSQQLGGEYHTLVFKNKCGKGPVTVVATYMDLEGQWVSVGWWKIPEGGVVESGAYSKNRVFYLYAHNEDQQIVWNGDGKPEAHETDVVDTAFVRKVQPPEPLLGKHKHSVNMFKVTVAPQWGNWDESFTCGG